MSDSGSNQLTFGDFAAPESSPGNAKKTVAKAPSNKQKISQPDKPSRADVLDAQLQSRAEALLAKQEQLLSPLKAKPDAKVETKTETKPETITVKKSSNVSEEEFIEEEKTDANKEPVVLTVSDLNKNIKGILEKSFPMIWVKGEISNFKIPSSGHMYFTLKDSGAQIKAVMFKGFAQSLKFIPEDGMEVLVRCRVTVYEPRGDYQLFCEMMEPVGYGALQIAFEKLKAKLQAEGLFDPKRKKALPAFPQRIGIITSPTGAAIRDMLNVLSRRSGGGLDITVLPVAVQGTKAHGEIAAAINLASKMGTARFDVLIIGRGGGSLEDLWSFNEEIVARAVAACSIPTISAVGHEVDFTICDFVADLRAPTPSAAAEIVVKNKADLVEKIKLLHRQISQLAIKRVQLAKSKFEGTTKRLIDPKRRLQDLMLRCDEWTDRLVQSVNRFLDDCATEMRLLKEKLGSPIDKIETEKQSVVLLNEKMRSAVQAGLKNNQSKFTQLAVLLNGLSPLAVLERGYSIVRVNGKIVKSEKQISKGEEIEIKLAEGQIKAKTI